MLNQVYLIIQSGKPIPEGPLLEGLVVGCRPVQLANADLLHSQAPQRALAGGHKLP